MKEFLTILKDNLIIKFIIFIAVVFFSWTSNAQVEEIKKYKPKNLELYNTIVNLDTKLFTAYNKCDLKTQAELIDENIEFFHDKGGLETNKQNLLASIEKNICNKVTRTLIDGSIEVYEIPNYGAIQIGYHKFFNKEEPNAKSIPSKFIVTWKKYKEGWKMTKVISLH